MIKTLSYAGKNLAEFSMFFDSSKIYKKPSKQFSGYDIPNRNGRLYQPNNKYSNVTIEYQCYIRENFGENFTKLINYLNSFDTYQRLEDTTDPMMYRMALFHAEVNANTGAFLKDGKFTLVFDCKPQEYYADGAEFERIVSHYDTYTGDPAVLVNEGESTVTNLKVALNPVQNLNGYDSPWIGGAGKNKLRMSLDGMKSANTAGTWSGNVYTLNSVTVTVLTNSIGSVIGIRANGTATGQITFNVSTGLNEFLTVGTEYYLSGTPSNAPNNAELYLSQSPNIIDNKTASGKKFTYDGVANRICRVIIGNGQTANNLLYLPMVRLASETDASFAPYENICPISGHTSASVTRTGKNLLNYINSRTSNGITYTYNSVTGAVHVSGTATSASWSDAGISATTIQPYAKLSAGAYIINGITGQAKARVQAWYEDGTNEILVSTVNGSAQFEITRTAWIYTRISVASGLTVDEIIYPMIRLASVTDATFEPYQGNTYTIDLNGTRYGGTVDLATGVLTVTTVSKTITSYNWTDRISNQNRVYTTVENLFGTDTPYLYGSEAEMTAEGLNLCDKMPVTNTGNNLPTPSITVGMYSYIYLNGVTHIAGVTDKATLNTWLDNNPLQVTYKLATPTTINLTPQQIELLTGKNYVSSSGEVTVITSTPLILKNPSPMTAKPIFKFTNISAPFTVSANGETIISFQNAIRLIKHAIANNMTFDANGTTLTVTKTGTPAYTETSILINNGYLPAGRYSFASATRGSLEVRSADGTQTYSSGGTFTLTDITQVKIWYVITPSASTPQTFSMPIHLRPLGDLYVNSEMMDCYMLDGDTAYSFNECVNLPKDFLQLDERTVMTMTSGAVGFIAPNWWRL